MKLSSLLTVVVSSCLTLLGAALGTSQAEDVPFRAGAATADLTPGAGVSLDGPISKPGPVRGVHDKLTARALVLELGMTKVLIVVNDMCIIDREVYDHAKKLVHQKTGIPVKNQLMAATHSHATPRVARISRRDPDEAYRKFVAERIAQAAIAAHSRLAPAKIGFGAFKKPGLISCRRFLCKPGSVGVNPFGEAGERIKSVAGTSNAVIRPAGPVDPGFSVLSVQHADGRPLAVLGNFSVHYCGGYAGGMVSADYFGVFARRLQERLSSGDKSNPFVGIMSNGTSGDTGSFRRSEGRKAAWSRMDYFGKLLADETLELLKHIEHRVPQALTMVSSELELGVRKPNRDRIDWATQLLSDPKAKGHHRWSRIYAQETLHLAEFPERYPIPLQAIRIDDIGIAAAPCEVFAETGLAIKKASPLKHTMTMELANGYSGYLPTPQQHEWGGYETWPARSSHLEVDAEPKIRAELLRLLGATISTEDARKKSQQPSQRNQDFDILIRNGTVIDGSGKPGFRADVGIRDGRIIAIGKLDAATGEEVVDATDRIVCPGFIDLHSHADRGILQFRDAENYIRQGATTLVCGNCGSSPIDVGEFFDKLRAGGAGPNIAVLIGHGSVRRKVIGPLNAPPSETQLAAMRRLVRKAMRDGAVGISTGLRYSPGAYADTKEIVALAKEVSTAGGIHATHMRDEGTRILEALDEALEIGKQADVPVHISHHKISSVSVFGLTRLTLDRIDRARKQGMDVSLDQYPYGAGSGSMSLYVPQASLSGGLEAFRKRVADPQQREKIIAGVGELLIRKIYESGQNTDNADHTAAALARIQVARASHDSKLEGRNVTQILRSRKQSITLQNGAELLVELVSQGVGGINHTLEARPGGDVDRVMKHPLTSIASDGGVFEFGSGHPHPRSYGCYPRVLARYVRERKLLTLEQAIHKMTALPAQRLGWTDCGEIKLNAWADVVVIDPKTVADKATFIKPHQHSIGIEHTIVRGQFVLKSGRMTGKLPGGPVGLKGPF